VNAPDDLRLAACCTPAACTGSVHPTTQFMPAQASTRAVLRNSDSACKASKLRDSTVSNGDLHFHIFLILIDIMSERSVGGAGRSHGVGQRIQFLHQRVRGGGEPFAVQRRDGGVQHTLQLDVQGYLLLARMRVFEQRQQRQ